MKEHLVPVGTAQNSGRPYAQQHPPPLPFTAQWTYELMFPRDPRGPGIVRITVRSILVAHGLVQLADSTELLASEMATNSVRHTCGPAVVRLHWSYPVLRGSVWDPVPELPPCVSEPGKPVPVPDSEADGGRGLFLLDLLADRWGGCPMGEGPFGPGGKSLWFELVLPGRPPSPLAA